MKTLPPLLLFGLLTNRRTFIGAFLWLVPIAVSGQDIPAASLKVLFIGNSYTSVNDLPAMVAELADAAGGRKIEVDRHLVGGCTLEKHVRDQKAIDKIQAKNWDVVVLQEQSLRPVIDRKSMHEYARLLNTEIKQPGRLEVHSQCHRDAGDDVKRESPSQQHQKQRKEQEGIR
jgi:hypothetical protein